MHQTRHVVGVISISTSVRLRQCTDHPARRLPFPTTQEAAIALHSSASELAQAILARKLTAEEVTRVFIRRSHVLGGAVNALTDALYDEALARAREIDAALAKGDYQGAPAPLLLGVPISVKDHVDVAGTDSTTGAAAKCFRPRAKDALVVELLKVGADLHVCVIY